MQMTEISYRTGIIGAPDQTEVNNKRKKMIATHKKSELPDTNINQV